MKRNHNFIKDKHQGNDRNTTRKVHGVKYNVIC